MSTTAFAAATADPARARDSALLSVRSLTVSYAIAAGSGARRLKAVDQVSFDVAPGEALGIVGESGSGKSSIARAITRLVPADSGEARFLGTDLLRLRGSALSAVRRQLQMIFQDPLGSLDPHFSVAQILAEPLRLSEPKLSSTAREQRVRSMLEPVGLSLDYLARRPHELSGGQAQRVAIARALMASPRLLICDEPLSALDVSIKSQIANLLKQLQERLQLSMLFISHDLAAVRFACHRLLVLYLGRVMELADRESLFSRPRHPYTRALLAAIPPPVPRARADRSRSVIAGEIPSPLSPPSGCVFRTRCPYAIERCAREIPALRSVGASLVACHRAEELDAPA